MEFCRIKGELKFLSVYTCATCGKKEQGTTGRESVDCGSTAELKLVLDGLRQTSHLMPVGWSYCGKFTCSKECRS